MIIHTDGVEKGACQTEFQSLKTCFQKVRKSFGSSNLIIFDKNPKFLWMLSTQARKIGK